MHTFEITLYEYRDLKEDAKKKAINIFREFYLKDNNVVSAYEEVMIKYLHSIGFDVGEQTVYGDPPDLWVGTYQWKPNASIDNCPNHKEAFHNILAKLDALHLTCYALDIVDVSFEYDDGIIHIDFTEHSVNSTPEYRNELEKLVKILAETICGAWNEYVCELFSDNGVIEAMDEIGQLFNEDGEMFLRYCIGE